ncbi:hypothetical protein PRUPE_6G248400 [Prunus persica]|uniref:non-specific serine/threonine protein kinase n=1 Tax=Prunus persica TaxID=3760 RepID=A0A251NVF1_PRUPE|nr:hypothetical protein PRUPE_6G248400 [Prunus persica]
MSTPLESATLPSASANASGNETDRVALLDLKKRITQDPLHVMSSWNDSIHFCSWVGVTCNPSTKRVLILDLSSYKLAGSLPSSIGSLTHLTGLSLRNNSFHGEIPQEMGRLRSLQALNVSENSLGGKIPTNISHCTQLRVLYLRFNAITGSIPDNLRSLMSLNHLELFSNKLTGTIPNWIGNFSSLEGLRLTLNNFHGSIPSELGRLTSLEVFSLAANNLYGIIPSSIYNISSIKHLSVSINQFHAELPRNLGINLPNLEYFYCGSNKFTGTIPASLLNSSRIQILYFPINGFTLKALDLSSNQFGGEFPRSIANLSTQLTSLYLGGNLIHGSVPDDIGNLVNLTILAMELNHLTGTVPDGIGKLQKLVGLYLNDNQFSGPIASSLGNLTSLTQLDMFNNRFEGSIPPSLGNCQSLLELNLSYNNITGTIPRELFEVSSLPISLDISQNYLTGSLAYRVGDLVNLLELDVSGNKLSGKIPKTLGSCIMLMRLYLEGSLEEIDISCNHLSGQIPEFLGKFTHLNHLNLSYNDFEGELPKEGIFSNASGLSVIGNNRLCGGLPKLRLHACSIKKSHSSQRLLALKVVIPVACALAFIIAMSCFIVARSKVKNSRGGRVASYSYKGWESFSYLKLFQSTGGFSVDNLIGLGSFGSVYKGVLPTDGRVVAVKVLNLQQEGASKSLMYECKVLRSIRHCNLLKIISACSSFDTQGNDFKSLVFEFMANGSLDSWLHRRDDDQSQSKRLSLIQRLNIANDVASALDYLHRRCETTIVHCDLKPNNVLLGEDMVAHVGDFGLARFHFCWVIGFHRLHSSRYEFLPPFSSYFGILLLEMFTGKRPTDDMFTEGLSIHQFAAMAMPDHAMDIIDPSLLIVRDDADGDDEIYNNDIRARPIGECLVSVMEIGLSCSAILPSERIQMDVVVNKMKAARDSYLYLRRRRRIRS